MHLKRAVNEFGLLETNLILDKVRELVIENFEKSDTEVKDGMDISICRFNPENKSLQWSGANNPLWVVKTNIDSSISNELVEYKPNKQPIGKFDNAVPFSEHTIQLEKNDCVYIFTDGYADQFGGEKGKKFMYKPLKELFISISELEMETQKNIIQTRFYEWKGTLSQVDDICIIGFKV
jgi:serine phosphatase RsbU (regulator of sigma subunit)